MIIREFLSGSIFFRNGTQKTFDDSSVISASVRRQACSGAFFDIGGVFAAQLTMKCRISGTNSFRLRGAKILLYSRYGSKSAFSQIGKFWITDAGKIAGEVYSITALDAVGWLDSSSFDASTSGTVFDSVAKYFESQGNGYTIQSWCSLLTEFVNSLIYRMTGEPNVLQWQDFDESVNGVYTNHFAFPSFGGGELFYFLSTESGSGLSDCPRDLFRHLARLAGGFIFANESGKLTLGQFGMPEFGTAEISESQIQADSCEIADYELQMTIASVQSEIDRGIHDDASFTAIPDYVSLAPMRIQLDANPFLDGFTAAYIRGDGQQIYSSLAVIVDGIWYFHHRFRTAGDFTEEGGYLGQCHMRPFSVTVHAALRFHIGQKIRIAYQGEVFESVITSLVWNFRGGWELSCAGSDSRTMADALRMNRAGKSLNESRDRCITLGKRIFPLSQEDYNSQLHDRNTLYIII